jgi:hypothetical protein
MARKRVKDLRNAAKNAKEAKKLKKRQERGLEKQGKLFVIYFLDFFIILVIIYYFTAAQCLPPVVPPITPSIPRYKLGDEVSTIPDSNAGIHPKHAEAIYGSVVELRFEGTWEVKVKSMHDGRNQVWTPEGRVMFMSKSINDNNTLEDKQVATKRQLEAAEVKLVKKRKTIKALKEKEAAFAHRIPALKRENTKLDGLSAIYISME